MILVAGEALIDLTRDPRRGEGYHPIPGGGPCNTAVALARLGVPTGYFGALGTDAFGTLLRQHLASAGVDLSLSPTTDNPTTLALATIDDAGTAGYAFYLTRTSATQLLLRHLPVALDPAVTAVHIGSLGLVLEPAALTIADLAASAATANRVVMIDPNIRPAVIDNMDGYLSRLDGIIGYADVVKLSDDDAVVMDPSFDPTETAAALLNRGPSLVVLTRGGEPAIAFHPSGQVEVPTPATDVVDTIGAGDSFGAGLLAWLHDNARLTKNAIAGLALEDLTAALGFAADVAAVTVSRPGADPPYREDLK